MPVRVGEVTSLIASFSPEMQGREVNYARITRGKARRDGARDDPRERDGPSSDGPRRRSAVLNDQECNPCEARRRTHAIKYALRLRCTIVQLLCVDG